VSLTVHVELRVKEEKLAEVQPLFGALLSETRGREGNEGVTVHQDQDAPTTILLVEQWISRGHYVAYNQWRTERGDFAKLGELLEEPPRRRFFNFVAV